MTYSRLHLLFRPRVQARISITFFSLQHVKGGFRQVPRHSSHRSRMSFAGAQPPVQPADVPLRVAPVIHGHGIRRFGKGPFQIPVRPCRVRSPLECTRGVVPL